MSNVKRRRKDCRQIQMSTKKRRQKYGRQVQMLSTKRQQCNTDNKEISKFLEQHRIRTWYIFVCSPFFLYLLCALGPGYRFNRPFFLSIV